MAPLAAVRRILTVLVAVAAMASALAPVATAAPAAWKTLARPWPANVAVRDVAAFAPAGIALAGEGSRVALSTNGGVTWLQREPDVQGSTGAITALDFRDASHGVVVGTSGLILVTSDGGKSWRSPTIEGGNPASDLRDVDLAGLKGYAVGGNGTLLATTDGGESWTPAPAVVSDALTTVATAADGTAVAGTDSAQLIMGSGSAWNVVGSTPAPILAVAASAQTAWNDSWPNLMVSLGSSLLGSTDGSSFDWSLGSTAGPWAAMAWTGMPSGDLLLAGSAGAVHSIDSAATAVIPRASTGIGNAVAAAAPGGQSVAYVLDRDGLVARTLSSAQGTATLGNPPARITAGSAFTLKSTVQIAAPGAVVLQGKVTGGAWRQQRSVTWTPASWGTQSFRVSPTLNSSYRLSFVYGGRSSVISGTSSVAQVQPKLTPNHLTYLLKRGTVYTFGGRAYPALAGEPLELLTDRGGGWHKIGVGGTVRLGKSGTWTSRRFGTPIRETYHLKAHIGATARHAEAWSAVVTVTIR